MSKASRVDSTAGPRPSPVVLACDTSTRVASLALMEGNDLTAESVILAPAGANHSRRLVADIDAILARRELTPAHIDLLVSSLGPGSFTGVRIALATLRGLAFALDKPLVGVCSLDALAHPLLGRSECVLAALDARRKEVYAALYAPDGETLIVPGAWNPERLAAEVTNRCPGDVIGVGEGIGAYRDVFVTGLGDRFVAAEPSFNVIRASVMADMGQVNPREGLEPLYCRRSEAEVKKSARTDGP